MQKQTIIVIIYLMTSHTIGVLTKTPFKYITSLELKLRDAVLEKFSDPVKL